MEEYQNISFYNARVNDKTVDKDIKKAFSIDGLLHAYILGDEDKEKTISFVLDHHLSKKEQKILRESFPGGKYTPGTQIH